MPVIPLRPRLTKEQTEALQLFVNNLLPLAEQRAILYEGVDNYRAQRGKDLDEYSKIHSKLSLPPITDIKQAKENPYFFREMLNEFLKNKQETAQKESKNLTDLLGKEGAKLYELARREERFDLNYINKVFKASTLTVEGPKWLKRPITPLLGPSGGGKSFLKKLNSVLQEITQCIPSAADPSSKPSTNTIITSDGGIERDESDVRKDMIAFAVMHDCEDIEDIDPLDGKLKKNILKAASKTEHLGIFLVTTASTHAVGTTAGKIIGGGELAFVEEMSEDPSNIVIALNIISADKENFKKTVQIGADARSQATKTHFDLVQKYANGELSYEKLLKALPEFKPYQPKHFENGYKGSANFAEAIRPLTKDNSILYSYRDLVFKKLNDQGSLIDVVAGGLEVPGTRLISERVVKVWNAKSREEKIEDGFKACFKTKEQKDANKASSEYIEVCQDGVGWKAGSEGETHWVTKEQFQAYQDLTGDKSNDFKPLLDAYNDKFSKPLIHTTGEFTLYALQKKFERSAPLDRAQQEILRAIQAFQLTKEPLENPPEIDRAKQYPQLIDALEETLDLYGSKLDDQSYKNIAQCIGQLKGETTYRTQVATDNTSQQTQRLYYDAQDVFNIKTSIKKKGDTPSSTIAGGEDQEGLQAQQMEKQRVVFKGDTLKKEQVIVAEARFGPKGLLYLEQDNTGKVIDKSRNLDSEKQQLAALKQAQMLLNNYDPDKGKILISGGSTEQAKRLYAAVIYFVKNDPEIKKRMESSRWLLFSTYSPEKLIEVDHFVPPKSLSDSFIRKHLPITQTKSIQSIRVLSNASREKVEKDLLAASKPIDIVQMDGIQKQKDFKTRIRQDRGEEATTNSNLKP